MQVNLPARQIHPSGIEKLGKSGTHEEKSTCWSRHAGIARRQDGLSRNVRRRLQRPASGISRVEHNYRLSFPVRTLYRSPAGGSVTHGVEFADRVTVLNNCGRYAANHGNQAP